MADTDKIQNIDDYINQYDAELQKIMTGLRTIIQEAAPGAKEKISWSMPTFHFHENVVHFAAHTNHIGLYPGADGIAHFSPVFDEKGYKYSKGAVQFPLSKPLPLDLVREIVTWRMNQIEKQHAF